MTMTIATPDELDLSLAEQVWIDKVASRLKTQIAVAADDKPYGDVEYADPGYQKDKKKRYPLNSETRVRAAWSYINMPKNADKYSPSQVSSIKAKIKAAGKKYGVKYNEDQKASGCLHTVFASVSHPMASIETDQIEAAKKIRALILQLVAMEAEEIADEGDEDSWDVECLLNAVREIEHFIDNEDMELFLEEVEDEDGSMVQAARKQADASAFNCPACGTAVKLQRKVKSKLVSAATSTTHGSDTMANFTDAELKEIAVQVAAILQAEAGARTVEEVRANPAEDDDPKLVIRADTRTVEEVRANPAEDDDPKLTLKADTRTVEDVRATPLETADPKMSSTVLPTVSSETETKAAKAKPEPNGMTENQESGSLTKAYKQPDEHKDDKAVKDKENPARAAAPQSDDDDKNDANATAKPADKEDEPAGKEGDKEDEPEDKKDGKADASTAQSIGRASRSYHLSDPKELAEYLEMVEANQRANDVFVGMSNLNTIPTERQMAHASASRRVQGGQQSVPGEQPGIDSQYDLTKLFKR